VADLAHDLAERAQVLRRLGSPDLARRDAREAVAIVREEIERDPQDRLKNLLNGLLNDLRDLLED
jgi:hypothetical protein